MKILFLIPPPLDSVLPAERIFGCNYGIYPQTNIFILYPATILKNKGYEVSCFDFSIGRKNKSRFNKFLEENYYDVIVFYTVFLSRKTDIIARDIIRNKNKNTKFIFISTEPTASPDDFVADDSVVIRGEPESRIINVVEALENGGDFGSIPGISFYTQGKIVHNRGVLIIDNLDELPFPDRSMLNVTRYSNPKIGLIPSTTMITSRGCSFNCYYCVPNSLDFAREIEFKREHKNIKPPVRVRSVSNIIAEFSALAKAGYKSVSFLDDQFVWGDKRTIEICEGIKNHHIEWSCLARADKLQNRDVVSAMAEAGCKLVAIGIESFNQDILDYIGKGCKSDLFYSAVSNLKEFRIEVELNILLGASPLENKHTIEQTFKEVLKLDTDYILFSICTPFPYTGFNERAKKEGWMIKPEYEAVDPMRKSFISYPHLTKEELELIIKRLYLKYYFRPEYLYKKIKKIRTLRDLFNKIKVARKIIGFGY